ncbi:right-handed parallel beta-helix repeat-containing protein [Micromonospora chalcea]
MPLTPTSAEENFMRVISSGEEYVGNGLTQIRAEILCRFLLGQNDGLNPPKKVTIKAVQIVGKVELAGASLDFGIVFDSCQLEGISMFTVTLHWLQVKNCVSVEGISLFSTTVRSGFTVISSRVVGAGGCALYLYGLEAGYVLLSGSSIFSSRHAAVDLSGADIRLDLRIEDCRLITVAKELAATYMNNASVSGTIRIDKTVISGGASGLVGIRAGVAGHFMVSNTEVSGSHDGLYMHGSQFNGSIEIQSCRFRSYSGRGFSIEYGSIKGSFAMSASTVAGGGKAPSLVLSGLDAKKVGIYDSKVTSEAGPAIEFVGISLTSYLLLSAVTASSCGTRPTVVLSDTQVHGALSLEGSVVTNKDERGNCLDLRLTSVGRLTLPSGVVRRSVDGASHSTEDGSMDLTGLTYSSLSVHDPGVDVWSRRLTLTVDFATQPFQQLARWYRSSGQEEAARRILILQQDELVRRGSLTSFQRITKKFLRFTLGYGYESWRAAWALVLVVTTSVLLMGIAGSTRSPHTSYLVAHTKQSTRPDTQCSLVERIGLGIDRSLPVVDTKTRARCDFNQNSRWAQPLEAVSWLLQLLGWALMTLTIVGYTGIVRRLY